jgi:hypothetical protein
MAHHPPDSIELVWRTETERSERAANFLRGREFKNTKGQEDKQANRFVSPLFHQVLNEKALVS